MRWIERQGKGCYRYAQIKYALAELCGIRFLMDIWIMEHQMDAHDSCAGKVPEEKVEEIKKIRSRMKL